MPAIPLRQDQPPVQSPHSVPGQSPTLARDTDWRTTLSRIGPQIAEEGRRCEAANTYVAANMTLLRENGFFELAVPEELGGAGVSRTELAALLRTLAHYCSATALTFSMHTHVVAAAAWRWKHQQAPTDGLLKRIAAERIQMLSSGGFDWLSGSGHAEKVEGGYRINARKMFASGAETANVYMTSAVAEGPDGPKVLHFGVPMTAEGISVVKNWNALGMRATGSHEVRFDNVFVADAAVAAQRKPGVWHPLMHVVAMVAFPLVYAVYTGVAEAARDLAVTAAKKRQGPGAVEAVGQMENEMTATRIALDSMVAFSETAMPGPETTNTIFMHRALIGRSAMKTVDLAMTAAGGAAYLIDLGLERRFRDIQAARFHPLTEGQQLQLAGRGALGMPIDD